MGPSPPIYALLFLQLPQDGGDGIVGILYR